jgi:predicted ATPase/DNA-binding winged helix-turn-helix (wHTH) protein
VTEIYRFGSFEVRPSQRAVLREGQAVPVGARALDLLIVLIECRGRLVTKSDLLDTVWAGLVVEEANVQVQVSGLRRLLGPGVIATVPGRGYRFCATLECDTAPADEAGSTPGREAWTRRQTNLPAAVEPLIGRAAEVDEVVDWLERHRLVAILGPGGIGKTRLAQEVGHRSIAKHPDGVWLIDLAPLDSAWHIVIAMANAAHVQVGGEGPEALEQLLSSLESRRMLVILDNSEHLTAAVGAFIEALQSRAAGVRVLVTSQEPVASSACLTYRLGPLGIPAAGQRIEQARTAGALQLLEARARAVDRRFALTPDNVDAAVDVVTQLDGNPLAIEMAAARVPALGLAALRRRLDERLELLRQTRKASLPRQQTLRATLEWSHSLLNPAEQAALRRLAAFVGSFRLDVAQAAVADTAVDEWAALDAISALVDKSLVQLEAIEPPRYRLLDTVRLFGMEQWALLGEAADVRARHGSAMAILAGEVEDSYWSMPDSTWLAQHAADYDDLRAAFDRACARSDADVAAITGMALTRLDHLRNVNAPRRQRAEALHALLPAAGSRARAWIWSCIASHGLIALEVVTRVEAARHAAEAWRAEGDPMRLHYALGFQAAESARVGDFATARQLLAQADALEDPSWPTRRRMWGSSARAGVCIHLGDAEGYRAASRSELALAIEAGAVRAAAWARLKLADAALMAGAVDEAILLGQEVVGELRDLQQPSNLGLALSNLCAALLQRGDPERARQAAIEALPLMGRNGWAYMLLDSVALLAAIDGDGTRALHLIGYTDAWYRRHHDSRQPNELALANRARAVCAAALDARSLTALVEAGERLSDAAAEAVARAALGDRAR